VLVPQLSHLTEGGQATWVLPLLILLLLWWSIGEATYPALVD